VPPADEVLNRVMIIMARFSTWALVSLILIATVASLLEKPLMSVVAPVYAQDHTAAPRASERCLVPSERVLLSAHWPSALWNTSSPRRLTFLACMLVAPVVMFGALAATPPLAMLRWPSRCLE
jgi:hypothetical protein